VSLKDGKRFVAEGRVNTTDIYRRVGRYYSTLLFTLLPYLNSASLAIPIIIWIIAQYVEISTIVFGVTMVVSLIKELIKDFIDIIKSVLALYIFHRYFKNQ